MVSTVYSYIFIVNMEFAAACACDRIKAILLLNGLYGPKATNAIYNNEVGSLRLTDEIFPKYLLKK